MADSRALLRWVLLFASPDSGDLQEAYALAKRFARSNAEARIGITIHGAQQVGEAERVFRKLASTALRHLQHSVVSYGLLVDDLHIYRAIAAQRPIGLERPQSRAARALRDVARLLLADARNHSVD
jgi:MinD-like ATPase involved in chromosome partitioning or flagellar assembly